MSDVMHPIPFEEIIHRICAEYRQDKTIFGIHEDAFHHVRRIRTIRVFNQGCTMPLGPAAGPHTQLAQNIIVSYLCGGRFIELKTVQKLDRLHIEKPCIDARDEGYNVEWSTEFTLEKAYAEYVKAYIVLHLIEALMNKGNLDSPSYIFNMSVGYDLAGIQTEGMQRFIDSMSDASNCEFFNDCIVALDSLIRDREFLHDTPWESLYGKLKNLPKNISRNISPSVTVSTMHGCPPQEIEAICTYLLTEKHLDTFVKLNPTLLGYDEVRSLLDGLGYQYIQLKRESFEHDLQYLDAVAMLKRLQMIAQQQSRGFGVKLTNTLGTINDAKVLPGAEQYMSGRALMPLSIEVASRLSQEFEGNLAISYSGGANAFTVKALFDTGIRPITLATDLLKPGGYGRLSQLCEILEKSEDAWDIQSIDVEGIKQLARQAKTMDSVKKDFRQEGEAKVHSPLPLWDCYIAPCVQACPIHQNVPDYIYLVGNGQYADALEVIYDSNPLPNITGYICDHQCQYHCTRLDYEQSVQIRKMKLIAAEKGFEEYVKRWEPPQATAIKAAVIGSGPAGLSAAYFLARAGFATEVFEKRSTAGGVVRSVIPAFRFPEKAIDADIDFIKRHGVPFHFNTSVQEMTVDALREAGFQYLFYAIGSEVDNDLGIDAQGKQILASLEFLREVREHSSYRLGASVVVVGGGNTAMDAARAAKRISGVREVTVVYRRSEREMPADKEEYQNAIADGISFRFLTNPEAFDDQGRLVCRVMTLGELDQSGRRRPVASDRTYTIQADTVISAIGERVDTQMLNRFGIPVDKKGYACTHPETLETQLPKVFIIGDAQSGPSTVVQCIASARKAVEAAIDQELGPEEEHRHDHDDSCGCCEHEDDEQAYEDEELEELESEEDAFFSELRLKRRVVLESEKKESSIERIARTEAKRCLECSYICNKCVDVCPNRANVAIDMRHRSDLFEHPFQIVHLDAFCNECGNCATFCPYEGKPYKDKLTLFSLQSDFDDSENNGFFVCDGKVSIRFGGHLITTEIGPAGSFEAKDVPEQVSAIIEQIITMHPYLLGDVEL